MKKLFVLLAAIAVATMMTGCASFQMRGTPVDCHAKLQSGTFAVPGYYAITIDRVYVDHNGTKWVHPRNTLDIQFYSYWQRADDFPDMVCNEVTK